MSPAENVSEHRTTAENLSAAMSFHPRWILLEIRPHDASLHNQFGFRIWVPRTWLAPGGKPRTHIRITKEEILRWRTTPGAPLGAPDIFIFEQDFGLLRAFLTVWRDRLLLTISCLVEFNQQLNVGRDSVAQGRILSGAVKLWTLDGFDERIQFFIPENPMRQLIGEIWPLKNPRPNVTSVVSAVVFGQSAAQIDILDRTTDSQPSRWSVRSLQWLPTRGSDRLWEAVDCPEMQGRSGMPARLTPQRLLDEPLGNLRQAVAATPLPLRVEASDQSDETAGVYYFVRAKTSNPPATISTVFRPGIGFRFRSRAGEAAWIPRSLTVERISNQQEIYRFSDSDEVGRILREGRIAASVTDPQVDLHWQRQSATSVKLLIQKLPTLYCKGSLPRRLSGGQYLWQLARTRVTRAANSAQFLLPVWLRYRIEDERPADTPFDPRDRIAGLSAPLVIEDPAGPGKSMLFLDVAQPATAALPRLALAFTVERTSPQAVHVARLQLAAEAAHVVAHTPPLDVYRLLLIEPSAMPNAKQLVRDPADDANLTTTSLVFNSTVPQSVGGAMAAASAQPLTASYSGELDFELRCGAGVVVAYLPYDESLVDMISPSRRNLTQRFDLRTGGTIVPRDMSHGLVPWQFTQFQFRHGSAGQLTEVVAMQLQPGDVHSVTALAPWIELIENRSNSEAVIRHLHHRNLVLEHDEFAAAAEDRASGPKPDAVPASIEDYLAAVRDRYTLACGQIGSAPRDMVNWLPGARLQDTSGNPVVPQVLLLSPAAGSRLLARLPKIQLRALDNSQQLALGHHQDWLKFDARLLPTAAAEQPRIELRRAASPSPGVGFRLRNSAAPLLLDLRAVHCATEVLLSGTRFVITGGADGAVQRWQADTGELVEQYAAHDEAVAAVVALDVGGEPHLLSAGSDGLLRLVRLADSTVVHEFSHDNSSGVKIVAAAAFAHNAGGGDQIWAVTGGSDQQVRLLDVLGRQRLYLLPGTGNDIRKVSLGVRLDGGVPQSVFGVARAASTAYVYTWKSPADTSQFTLTDPDASQFTALDLRVHAADIHVASGHQNGRARLWQQQTDHFDPSVSCADPAQTASVTAVSLAHHLNQFHLLTGSADGTVRGFVKPSTSQSVQWLGHAADVSAVHVLALSAARSYLLSAGIDGTARLWDVEATYETRRFHHQHSSYDNLGLIRPARHTTAAGPWYMELVSFPQSTTRRTADLLQVLAVSYYADQPLVQEGQSEFFFSCEGLKLIDAGAGLWVPLDLSQLEPNGSARSGAHRGHAGVFGFYSQQRGRHGVVDDWPRLAGVPFYVVRLTHLRISDQGAVTEIKFDAVLVNPTEVIGQAESENVPSFVKRAVARRAVVKVTLQRVGGGKFTVAGVDADSMIDWSFSHAQQPTAAFPFPPIDGRLSRLVADVAYRNQHLYLTTRPAESRATVLGRIWPLGSPPVTLRSWARNGEFGFETIGGHQVPQANLEYTGGHAQTITGVAIGEATADFVLVSGSRDGAAHLWDAATGVTLQTFAHPAAITSVACGRFSVAYVLGCGGETVAMWDAELAHRALLVSSERPLVHAALVSHDGAGRLATFDVDGVVTLWDASNGRQLIRFVASDQPVADMDLVSLPAKHSAVESDVDSLVEAELYLLLRGQDGALSLWDAPRGLQIASERMRTIATVLAARLEVVNGELRVLTGSADDKARLWPFEGDPLVFSGHSADVTAVRLVHVPNPDTSMGAAPRVQRLVSGSADKTVRFWDFSASPTTVQTLGGHPATITKLDYATWGELGTAKQFLLAGYQGHRPRLWNVTNGQRVARFDAILDLADSARFVPVGNAFQVLTIENRSQGGIAKLWDFDAGSEIQRFELPASAGGNPPQIVDADVQSLATLHVVTGGENNTARVWDVRTARVRRLLDAHTDAVTAVALGTFQGQPHVLTGCLDGKARLWNLSGDPAPREFDHPGGAVIAVAFANTADGNGILTGCADDIARLWNEDGLVHELAGHRDDVTAVAFISSSAGPRVLTGGKDNTVRLWKADDGALLRELPTPYGVTSLSAVEWTGHLYALTGAADHAATLWTMSDSTAEAARWSFGAADQPGPQVALAATPDGLRVFTGMASDRAAQWEVSPLLRISSQPSQPLLFHLAVDLRPPQSAAVELQAAITPGNRLSLLVKTDRPIGTMLAISRGHLAIPAIVQGIYYGFVLAATAADGRRGRAVLVLWVEGSLLQDNAGLSGILLSEEFSAQAQAQLVITGSIPVQSILLEGPRIRLRATPFSNAPVSAGSVTTAAGEVTVTSWHLSSKVGSPQRSLTLHIGEQTKSSSDQSLVAHLAWADPSSLVQAPVVLQQAGMDDRFSLAELIYLANPVEPAGPAADEPDIVFPLGNGQTLDVALRGATRSTTTGTSFVRLIVKADKLQLELLPEDWVPLNLCLQSEALRTMPILSARQVRLLHRRLLGNLLRLSLPHVSAPGSGGGGDFLQHPSRGLQTPAPQPWLLNPVRVTQTEAFVYEHNVLLDEQTTSQTSDARTENLLILQRESSAQESAGEAPLACLFSTTATAHADQVLLDDQRLQQRLIDSGAAGVAVHRILQGGGPSEFRFVASPFHSREIASSEAESAPAEATLITLDSAAALAAADQLSEASSGRADAELDFRVLTPRQTKRWRLRFGDRYLPIKPEADPQFDSGQLACRRIKYARRARQNAGGPVSEKPQYRLHIFESTALARMEPLWYVPPQPALLNGPRSPATLSAPFQPHNLQMVYAPDKPGAMLHHKLHAAVAPAAADSQPTWQLEPLVSCAFRDPQQFQPPAGADLSIIDASATSASFGLEDLSIRWREILGRLDLPHPDPAIHIEQVERNPEVRFRDHSTPLRVVVQINEELLEIDSLQPHVPIYHVPRALQPAELQPLSRSLDHRATIDAVAASPQRQLLTAGQDRALLWVVDPDAPPEHPEHRYTVDGVSFNSVAFAELELNDGGQTVPVMHVLAGGSDHTARLWKFDESAPVRQFHHGDGITAVAFVTRHENDVRKDYVATAGSDGKVRLWDAQSGSSLINPAEQQHEQAITHVSLIVQVENVSGQPVEKLHLLTASSDKTVKLWDVAVTSNEFVLKTTFNHPAAVNTADIIEMDKLRVLTGSDDGTLRLWDFESGALQASFQQSAAIRSVVAVPSDFRPLAATTAEDGVRIWDLRNEVELRRTAADAPLPPALAMAVMPFGGNALLATSHGDHHARLWNPQLLTHEPPKIFLSTRLPDLLADVPVTIALDALPDPVEVMLHPHFVIEDRESKETLPYPLGDIFSKLRDNPGGYSLWQYPKSSGNVALPWHRAGRVWISWRGTINAHGQAITLEAVVYEQSGKKAIKPTPYSAVAPKIAAVLFVDNKEGSTQIELLQRTILFGDSAPADAGTGELDVPLTSGGRVDSNRPLQFRYLTEDHERLTVGIPAIGDNNVREVLLIKHLIDGQTLVAAKEVTPA